MESDPDVRMVALQKYVAIEGMGLVEFDIFAKNIKTGEGIIESVKNTREVNIADAQKAVEQLVEVKGKRVDGVEVKRVRLVINEKKWAAWVVDRHRFPTIDELMTTIENNGVDVVLAAEVK